MLIRSSKKLWVISLGLIVLGFFWYEWQQQGETLPDTIEVGTVGRATVAEILTETGAVKALQAADLAFTRGGRVGSIHHRVGEVVEAGAVLIELETTELAAQVEVARARVVAEEARLLELMRGVDASGLAVTDAGVAAARVAVANAERALAETTAQQDLLVGNAKKALLSGGLMAYLESPERGSGNYDSPTISGTYTGADEGVYVVELYNSGAISGSSYRVSGLEVGGGEASTVKPTPLGTRGLYLTFPSDFAPRTKWEIPVPNTRSSSYVTLLSAYTAAVENRRGAVTAAENALLSAQANLAQVESQKNQVVGSARSERVVAQEALVQQMKASLLQAEAALAEARLVAPFAGVVTGLMTETGQIVGAGQAVVLFRSTDGFELEVSISEIDIAEVSVGDQAIVTFDAFEEIALAAEVIKIAPAVTVENGLRTFLVTLALRGEEPRLRHGLTAEIELTTEQRPEVVAIPTRSIYEDETGKFVRLVSEDGTLSRVPVTTGLRGTNGLTEIVSGLSGGEQIIMFASEEDLALISE